MSWMLQAIETIDPAGDWQGHPTGLRDRALLALLEAGLQVSEIRRLTARHVYQDPEDCDRLVVQWSQGFTDRGRRHTRVVLTDHQAAQVLAYLLATRAWQEPVPLIRSHDGRRLTEAGLHSIVHQHRSRVQGDTPAAAANGSA